MKTIYLDNGASTKVDPKVLKTMEPYFIEFYGNASSTHRIGAEAKLALGNARRVIAKAIGAKEEEIYFTSGGTESNNLAVKGLAFAEMKGGGECEGGKERVSFGESLKEKVSKGKSHIITTKVEHACILNSCKWLESLGFEVTYLNVDKEGFVDLKELENAIRPGKTFLVSIIHGNNEIGTIQDLKMIGEVCRKHGVLFHTDACQSFTKVPIDVRKMNVDLMTLNSHKIHGPKGVGALYVRSGIKIVPVMHGGGHEKGLRAGTENISGIVGFAEAVKLAKESHVKDMIKLRNFFIEEVLKAVPDAKLNGPRDSSKDDSWKDGSAKRLCNNINIAFPVGGEMLGDYLNFAGVCTSKGSACSSNESNERSHVLKAIGRSDFEIKNSIRFTISRFTTKEELEKALKILIKSVEKTRKSRFA